MTVPPFETATAEQVQKLSDLVADGNVMDSSLPWVTNWVDGKYEPSGWSSIDEMLNALSGTKGQDS